MSESTVVYPYVVDRLIATVYLRRPVWFGLGVSCSGGAIVVPGPAPADRNALSPEQREAVVDAALAASIATRRRHCVVFGPRDAVCVEPDGSRQDGVLPPSGGIALEPA